jgi:fatty acid desaturase
LNYHLHLAHHDFPRVPWNHLPKYVDPRVPRPSFWRIYFEMWKGPKAYVVPFSTAELDARFLGEIRDDALCGV